MEIMDGWTCAPCVWDLSSKKYHLHWVICVKGHYSVFHAYGVATILASKVYYFWYFTCNN